MNRIPNGNTTMALCERSKDWQLEILMEKLRSKASQYKSLTEISKNVRMTMLDKRYALDNVEKSQHQKCLDTLQNSIKVTSLQSMVERLESLTRQLGLKFMVGPSDVQLFISSDMFYLEILLNSNGEVQDVKVHHEGKMEQQSCSELVACLSSGDFEDFTAQLEGFAAIYQLNAEKKIKTKAFTALQSLESDLSALAQLQSFMKEPFNLVYKSPVGVLEKRRGGHPMKLTYFVAPYEMIDVEKGEIETINIETIIKKKIGLSVTVCMEGSAAHKLQTTTLITVSRSMNGKSSPSFAPLSTQNSSVIPATFVLKLNKAMPMCINLAKQLQVITELEWINFSTKKPLLNLIVSECSDGKLKSENNQGLFVNLPDQNHCYFMTDNKNVEGVLVSSVHFTHPTKVAQILVILRQQALFNTLISSCVRPKGRQTFDNMFMLEITALSWSHISISLEHPTDESMATAEIDLSEISRLTCKIHTPGTPPPPNAPDTVSEIATQALNKSFSIPVTMRSIIKFWEKQQQQTIKRNQYGGILGGSNGENFSLGIDTCDPGGGSSSSSGGGNQKGNNNNLEFEGLDGNGGRSKQETMYSNESTSNFPNFPSSEGMLEIMGGSSGIPKTKQTLKRNKSDDHWTSKRKTGGDDDIILESSNSSSDSTSGSTSICHQDVTDIPNSSSLGFQSDLELSTLDPSELEKTVISDSDNNEVLESIREAIEKCRRNSGEGDVLSNLVPSSVSITPISTTSSPTYNQERRSSIEITPSPLLTNSSITITPIPSQSGKTNDDKYKERKSGKSKSDDKNRLEKKRKRKRDESPMGPPEKIPPKQDSSLKPAVSISIKPSESPPLSLNTPPSPGILKYSTSPTHRNLSGKMSPNLVKQRHQSPKNSPAHVPSSPKHSIGITSPKNHGASPKHPSAGGSGKPSMSTLKNATHSPKSESSKTKSTSKELSRDKEKKQSNTFQSISSNTGGGSNSSATNLKNKMSSKIALLDINISAELLQAVGQEGQMSPSSLYDGKSTNLNQIRRKGMLSAIVDKLKSAQHTDSSEIIGKLNNKLDRGEKISGSQLLKTNDSKIISKSGGVDMKNSEYMVKPSSDGIKLTINKTRTKDVNKSIGNKTGIPKVHTGLKPGVNSGPASKKPQQHQFNQKNSSALPNSSKNLSKPSSIGSSMNRMKSTSFSGPNKDKLTSKLSKSNSEKSIFSLKEKGKSSPTPRMEEQDALFKYNASMKMEGLMKQLDKNFQIPKLSARQQQPPPTSTTQTDDKKQAGTKTETSNRSPSDSKIFEMSSSKTNETKYPLALPNNKIFESIEAKIRNNMNAVTVTSPSTLSNKNKEEISNTNEETETNHVVTFPVSVSPVNATKTFGNTPFGMSDQPLSLSMKTVDLTKFATPDVTLTSPRQNEKKDSNVLLDFSKGANESGVKFPASPSVSVHIVKSPAPNPSPRTISPRLDGEDLGDEALVGLGK